MSTACRWFYYPRKHIIIEITRLLDFTTPGPVVCSGIPLCGGLRRPRVDRERHRDAGSSYLPNDEACVAWSKAREQFRISSPFFNGAFGFLVDFRGLSTIPHLEPSRLVSFRHYSSFCSSPFLSYPRQNLSYRYIKL